MCGFIERRNNGGRKRIEQTMALLDSRKASHNSEIHHLMERKRTERKRAESHAILVKVQTEHCQNKISFGEEGKRIHFNEPHS